MPPTVANYRGHRRTLLQVRLIKRKACALIIRSQLGPLCSVHSGRHHGILRWSKVWLH